MSFTLRGDIKIKFRHHGYTGKPYTFCRMMFNTAFIQNGNYICAGKMQLSPEDIRKDKGKMIPEDFKVYVFFDDFCIDCNPHRTEIEELCEKCRHELGPDIISQWREVKQLTDHHDFPSVEQGRKLLAGVSQQKID